MKNQEVFDERIAEKAKVSLFCFVRTSACVLLFLYVL